MAMAIITAARGGVDAHPLEQLGGALGGALAVDAEFDPDDFRELITHRQHRVQACHRILEDHPDTEATDSLEPRVARAHQLLAPEPDTARGDGARTRHEAQQGPKRDALAGPGLAHDAQGLSLAHHE
jgi:hypothetical protein